jgi:ribonuclease PH
MRRAGFGFAISAKGPQNHGMRRDDRHADDLRPVEIIRGFTRSAPGSVLIRTGDTHIFCTASIEEGVPPWREASGFGWVTAEYEMLPGSTGQRRQRTRARIDGRTQEIQRLIGRSLRVAVDMSRMGPHTIFLDCDVLQADGGTRTTAINGAYVALCDALRDGRERDLWKDELLTTAVAATSVGVVNDEILLDLDYREDLAAAVDCNLVMTGRGEWVEVQATGEGATYRDALLAEMMALGRQGIERLFTLQREALDRDSGNER